MQKQKQTPVLQPQQHRPQRQQQEAQRKRRVQPVQELQHGREWQLQGAARQRLRLQW